MTFIDVPFGAIERMHADTEIASSLTLQVVTPSFQHILLDPVGAPRLARTVQVLYYHFVYSLAWFAIQLHQVPWKARACIPVRLGRSQELQRLLATS